MSMETPNPNEAAPAEKRASGSSFYTAMRILPQAQRDAMFEIYSFCRAVDDVADSTGPREQRVDELATWRNDIAAISRAIRGAKEATEQPSLIVVRTVLGYGAPDKQGTHLLEDTRRQRIIEALYACV